MGSNTRLDVDKFSLLCEQLAITTKRIHIHSIRYLSSSEITDKIFINKNNDDEGQTSETQVSNK